MINDDRLADVLGNWVAADDRLMREMTITQTLSAPVGFIDHNLTDVNKKLKQGRPFFNDIAAKGIALYEAEGFRFAAYQSLRPPRCAKKRRNILTHGSRKPPAQVVELVNLENDEHTDAAFTLRQAAERAYRCTLLVLMLCARNLTNLAFYRARRRRSHQS